MAIRLATCSFVMICGASANAFAGEDSGARPGDENLSCAQIATQMQPYAASMRDNIAAVNETNAQLVQMAQMQRARDAPSINATTQAAGATCGFVGGPACMAATATDQANRNAVKEREAAESKPLRDQNLAQTKTLVAQGQALQSNAHLMHLMQLGQAKGCDKQQRPR